MKQIPVICKIEFPGDEFWIYVNISSSDNILFEIKKALDVLSGSNVTEENSGFWNDVSESLLLESIIG
jgi:hypothetical protein